MAKKNISPSKVKAPSPAQNPINWLKWIPVILSVLVYINTLGHQYTLDDFSVIKDNFVVKRGLSAIGTIMTTDYRYGYWMSSGTLYRPLSLVMFAIEWSLSPDNPMIGHLINVGMLACTMLVLFSLLQSLLGDEKRWWNLGICLLFAAHPIHTEVIANIKSRDEIMAMLFGLLTIKYFMKYLSSNKLPHLFVGLFSYVLALFSKESAITLLAILPLTAYFFSSARVSSFSKKTLFFLIPAAIFLLVRQKVIGGNISLDTTSILDNFILGAKDPMSKFASAMTIMGYYIWGFIFPITQTSDYGYSQIPLQSIGSPIALISILFHIGLTVFAFVKWKSKALWIYGWFFYLIGMSLVCNIFISIGTSYGERLVYMPSLGLCIAFVGIMMQWLDGAASKNFKWTSAKYALLAFIGLCSVKTIARNPAWYDSYTLYKADVETSPNSAKLNYHYALEVGKKALDEKTPEAMAKWRKDAIALDEKAIAIMPSYNDAYAHIGLMYYHLKNGQKSEFYYKKAIELGDKDAKTYSNLGTLYSEYGRTDDALMAYKKAVELDPRFVDARRNLGCMHAIKKEFPEAIKEFKTALEYDPGNPDILYFMGSAYKDSGDAATGDKILEEAYSKKPELRR